MNGSINDLYNNLFKFNLELLKNCLIPIFILTILNIVNFKIKNKRKEKAINISKDIIRVSLVIFIMKNIYLSLPYQLREILIASIIVIPFVLVFMMVYLFIIK